MNRRANLVMAVMLVWRSAQKSRIVDDATTVVFDEADRPAAERRREYTARCR